MSRAVNEDRIIITNDKDFGKKVYKDKHPLAVYYRVENEDIRIHAVLDCRKNPKSIHERLN